MTDPNAQFGEGNAFDEREVSQIHDQFWKRAREIAHRKLTNEARSLVDSEDIASMAMKSALSSFVSQRKTITSPDDFEKFLVGQICDKASEAHRKAMREKRNPRREVRDASAMGQTSLIPDLDAANSEIDALVTCVVNFIRSEPDEIKRTLYEFYFFDRLNGEGLMVALNKKFGAMPFSERAMYRQLQAAKADIMALLAEVSDDT